MSHSEDFSYIKNIVERERLLKLYNVISKLHLWDFLEKTEINLFAFGNILNILRELDPQHYNREYILQDLNIVLSIAKRGEETIKTEYLQMEINREKYKGREWEQQYYRENYIGGCRDTAIPPPI
jgi:hypothetical protein